MSLSFEQAAEQIKQLNSSPSNEVLLELYALYKQGTVGDNNTAKSGTFDFKGKAKWSAWNDKKGMKMEDAKAAYVALVANLVEKHGTK